MRSWILHTGNSILFLLMAMISQGQKKSLNVIYILTDDLGYSELGCYGNSFNETPALDQMAATGMRFTQFYAAAPVCSPYRAALMTGQYPARLGITDYLRPNASKHLDLKHTTLAEMFKENGYRTGIVGKWHLSGYVREGAAVETLPDQHGFDEVMVSENRGIGEGTYFHPYLFNLEIQKTSTNSQEYITDRQNAEALEFIKRHKAQPFFLYLSHYAVHTTVHGPPELVKHFENKKGAGMSPPTKQNPTNDPYKKWPAGSKSRHNNPHLAAQLKVVDNGVAAIMELLKTLGIDQNTLVIFTSDNGGETTISTNAPLRGGKSMLYEGGVRVPFIAWAPSHIRPGGVHQQPLVNYDMYPTLMALIGAKPNTQQVDGISFAHTLQHPAKKLPNRNLYWHYPLDQPHFLGGRSASSLIQNHWKLIEFLDTGTLELYDLKKDWGEKKNLAGKFPQKARELQTVLANWRMEMNASNH